MGRETCALSDSFISHVNGLLVVGELPKLGVRVLG
jgi:hypothetical protein